MMNIPRQGASHTPSDDAELGWVQRILSQPISFLLGQLPLFCLALLPLFGVKYIFAGDLKAATEPPGRNFAVPPLVEEGIPPHIRTPSHRGSVEAADQGGLHWQEDHLTAVANAPRDRWEESEQSGTWGRRPKRSTPYSGVPPLAVAQGAPEGPTLVVIEGLLPNNLSLTPLDIRTAVEKRLLSLVFEPPFIERESGEFIANLIALDPDTNMPVFSPGPGGLRATGTLTQAVFHNNQPVTVDDLKASYEAYAAASELYRSDAFYRQLVEDIQGVGSDPQRSFSLTLKERRALQQMRFAFELMVLPRSGFSQPDRPQSWPRDKTFRARPIGTGPFMPQPRKLGESIMRFNAFSAYHQGSPYISQLEIRSVPAEQDKINQMRGGSAHVAVSVNQRDVGQLRSAAGDVYTRSYPVRNWWYMGFNCQKPLLGDLKVRQALNLVLNRRSLAGLLGSVAKAKSVEQEDLLPVDLDEFSRGIESASVEVISGPFVPTSHYYNWDVPQQSFDRRKAKEMLLSNKHLSFDESRGYWMYDGDPWTLNLAVDAGLPDAESVATAIQKQFGDFGIVVEVQMLSGSEWDQQVDRRDGGGGWHHLMLGRWHFGRTDDIRGIFHSKGKLNIYYYQSAVLDQLFANVAQSTDFDQRRKLMQEAHAHLANEVPCVFLWRANQMAAFSTRVRGTIEGLNFYVNPHEWRLTPKKSW